MRETTRDSPYDPPNAHRVLEILKEAGEEGIIAPDIARRFTIADPVLSPSHLGRGKNKGVMTVAMANLQRRLTHTNQILNRFLMRGWVAQGPMERSPHYHRVLTYRWFITQEGAEYLSAGMGEGVRAAREAERERKLAELAVWRQHLGELITQAYIDFDPAVTPKCERDAAIRTLRDAGCTLDSIGGVFDVTRERVRQIANGIRPGRCRCPRCAWKGALR